MTTIPTDLKPLVEKLRAQIQHHQSLDDKTFDALCVLAKLTEQRDIDSFFDHVFNGTEWTVEYSDTDDVDMKASAPRTETKRIKKVECSTGVEPISYEELLRRHKLASEEVLILHKDLHRLSDVFDLFRKNVAEAVYGAGNGAGKTITEIEGEVLNQVKLIEELTQEHTYFASLVDGFRGDIDEAKDQTAKMELVVNRLTGELNQVKDERNALKNELKRVRESFDLFHKDVAEALYGAGNGGATANHEIVSEVRRKVDLIAWLEQEHLNLDSLVGRFRGEVAARTEERNRVFVELNRVKNEHTTFFSGLQKILGRKFFTGWSPEIAVELENRIKQVLDERDAFEKERKLAHDALNRVQDERMASFSRLQNAVGGCVLTGWQPEVDLEIEGRIKQVIRERTDLEADLAAAQKALLDSLTKPGSQRVRHSETIRKALYANGIRDEAGCASAEERAQYELAFGDPTKRFPIPGIMR